jgi:hypothetical protein
MSRKIEPPSNNGAEQLTMFSEEVLTKLQRPSALLLPKDGLPFCESNGVRKACPLEGYAIQDELPFLW